MCVDIRRAASVCSCLNELWRGSSFLLRVRGQDGRFPSICPAAFRCLNWRQDETLHAEVFSRHIGWGLWEFVVLSPIHTWDCCWTEARLTCASCFLCGCMCDRSRYSLHTASAADSGFIWAVKQPLKFLKCLNLASRVFKLYTIPPQYNNENSWKHLDSEKQKLFVQSFPTWKTDDLCFCCYKVLLILSDLVIIHLFENCLNFSLIQNAPQNKIK